MFKLYVRGRLKFKRMKKYIYHLNITFLKKKKSKSGYINTRQSRLQNKKIIRDKERNYVMKRVNLPGRHNNLKCICSKPASLNIYEAKNDRVYRRNRQIHS